MLPWGKEQTATAIPTEQPWFKGSRAYLQRSKSLCSCTTPSSLVLLNEISAGWFLQVALSLAGMQARRESTHIHAPPGADLPDLAISEHWALYLRTTKTCSVRFIRSHPSTSVYSPPELFMTCHRALRSITSVAAIRTARQVSRLVVCTCNFIPLFPYSTLLLIISTKYSVATYNAA